MLFNSLDFLIFFPTVVFIYYATPYKWRKHLLLIASWYFYMSWKTEYILLIIFSTLIDYYAAIEIQKNKNLKKRKYYLLISIIINLGVLFTFKYYNFISESIHHLFSQKHFFTHQLLLPVGISFYTFQSMSYTIDVYRKRIKAEKSFVQFALFVSFFPQLVAGPIERAGNLLAQFDKYFDFDYKRISYGLKLMFWGFFQKIVIADNMARFVDTVYNNPQNYYGFDILWVTFLFAIQIYADFSGYTDIARGAAQVMGYKLMLNFRRPYFSSSLKEFWQSWHISLSTWFKDYVYISLGGNREGRLRWVYAIMLTFILSGLWHGAKWTFVIWGTYHAILYLAEDRIRSLNILKCPIAVCKIFKVLFVFTLILIGWIIFRANSVNDLFILLNHLFSKELFQPKLSLYAPSTLVNLSSIIILLTVWFIERKKNIIEYISEKPIIIRWLIYFMSALWLIGFGNWGLKAFIYFQF